MNQRIVLVGRAMTRCSRGGLGNSGLSADRWVQTDACVRLRGIRSPLHRTGHRPPSVLVTAVTKIGEVVGGAGHDRFAPAVIRPAWPVHNLWLPVPLACGHRHRIKIPPDDLSRFIDRTL